jgi:hypothetical protein
LDALENEREILKSQVYTMIYFGVMNR